MTKKQMKKRIEYLKIELAHERYWDGWVLEGMRAELKELEEEFKESNGKENIGQYIGLNRSKK
jgi:hypothetical protein